MVDKTGSPPPPTPPNNPTPPENKSTYSWHPKPMTWLGMHFDSDQTKKLWTIISQNVSREIEKEKDKAIKAIKKMGSDRSDDDS